MEGSGCRRGGEGPKAARAGALLAHTHTHSLTLPAKAESAGDVPSRRARIHCARAHSLSIHSVWGGAGLLVLNVGPKRGKPEDEDTDLATVQKGLSTLCTCDVLADAHVWNHIAYLLQIRHIVYS